MSPDRLQGEPLFEVRDELIMAPLEGMSPLEIATGVVAGPDNQPKPTAAEEHRSPREVLAHLVLPALLREPCVVEFSGGRDSSLLLAVAVATARKEGLAQPVAATKRYPKVRDSLEDEWQEQVVRHLGVTEWVRFDVDAELDAISPLAQRFLPSYGVVWPPMLWSIWPFVQLGRGGTLLHGGGGDEVFGERRVVPLARVVRARDFRRITLRRGAAALAPPALRKPLLRRRHRERPRLSWLRPDARAAAVDLIVKEELSEPLDWRASLFWQRYLRSEATFVRNASRLAAAAGAQRVMPFLDPSFLAALGRAGGRLGYPSRTAALRANFIGLLPDEVLSRRTKARFNGAWFGPHTRAFVERWDGRGVDDDLVDPEALRQEWLSDAPSGMSVANLQAAWLAGSIASGAPRPRSGA